MVETTELPCIGAHVSVAGGLVNGITNALEIGASCIQIFGASPRQWAVRHHNPKEIDAFIRRRGDAGIRAVFLHAAYLVNLASPDSVTRARSEENLAAHFAIAQTLRADGLIFHIGSGKELPKRDAEELVVASLGRILKAVPGNAQLIIENGAGGGQKIGSSPEEIGELIRRVASPRIGVCWDTAHAFEAGIIERYDRSTLAALAARFDQSFGIERLCALHVNDSKSPFNSHHDRHENIGEGYIGMSGFQALAAIHEFRSVPWLLEVPGFSGAGPDRENVERLKQLFR